MIPYGKQDITQSDVNAVVSALKSDFITQGPKVEVFEQEIAKFVGAKYAIASNSATSSLHVACVALGIERGDIVWAPAISFVATSNAAVYCGATIKFLDIDKDNFNISIKGLEIALQKAKKEHSLPKLIIVTHMCGQSCDMFSIHKLSKKYKFKIIEDASHAIGASYKGKKVGSCVYSDITVFSFHPVKIITTVEGGICVTNKDTYFRSIKKLITHGITRNTEELESDNIEPWFYEQQLLGFNYRMNELQAALGLSQLKRLNSYIKKRNTLAKRYYSLFRDSEFITPRVHKDCVSSFHLFVIRLSDDDAIYRNDLFRLLRKKNIGVNLHYIPIYRHPFYRKQLGFRNFSLQNSEIYYSSAISIPLFPGLSAKQQKLIVHTMNNCLSNLKENHRLNK